jgi:signal transduction histidine kinase/ActR/RegA family two-component response regulator
MKEQTTSKLTPWYSGVALTMVFCLWVIVFENHTIEKAQENLERHALVVADALWNFNSAGVKEYLRLAAEADHYLSLKILNKDEQIFQAISIVSSSGLEQLLLSAHIIPKVKLSAPVLAGNDLIGWIKAVWIPDTLPTHASVCVFLLLVHVVIVLYCRILRHNHLLEERVGERTAALSHANEALKREIEERALAEKAREELQRSLERSKKMESLGLLAGGVAHDLNNVLSGIVSYPDLLLHDMPHDHPLRRVIITIRDSGMRAAQIVQDLLTLARRGVVSKKILNLNHLIEEYCNSPEYRKLLDVSTNLSLELDLEPNPCTICGSAIGLKKVLMNLITNGAEAQPNGGKIVVATRNQILNAPQEGFQHIPAGKYAVLSVSDQGEGISAEDRQKIFEPFYTKKVMGRSGTGLGLTVVWGTVEDHGGVVDLDSLPGQGTTISVYLPVCEEDEESEVGERETRWKFLGHGEAILVVDDLIHQREIACAMLKRMNFQPIAVASGEEALELLKTRKVDLLLLDMILDGGIDGLETFRRILAIHPGQRAIIASGFSESDRVRETQHLGAGVCLKKPYTYEELAAAIWQELYAPSAGQSV